MHLSFKKVCELIGVFSFFCLIDEVEFKMEKMETAEEKKHLCCGTGVFLKMVWILRLRKDRKGKSR